MRDIFSVSGPACGAKMSGIVSKMSSYAWSAEQAVVYVTLTVIGASLGLLEGTFKGFQKLQPNLTSRQGFEDLIYGSNHRGDRDRHSIADLIASWIPIYKKHPQPAIEGEWLTLMSLSGTEPIDTRCRYPVSLFLIPRCLHHNIKSN